MPVDGSGSLQALPPRWRRRSSTTTRAPSARRPLGDGQAVEARADHDEVGVLQSQRHAAALPGARRRNGASVACEPGHRADGRAPRRRARAGSSTASGSAAGTASTRTPAASSSTTARSVTATRRYAAQHWPGGAHASRLPTTASPGAGEADPRAVAVALDAGRAVDRQPARPVHRAARPRPGRRRAAARSCGRCRAPRRAAPAIGSAA